MDQPADAQGPKPMRRTGWVITIVAPIVLLGVAVMGLVDRTTDAPERSAANPPVARPALERPAFVIARALSCRSAPTRQAPRVAQLGRGVPVEILAYDGNWASLTYGNGQCWARTRYLSLQRPS